MVNELIADGSFSFEGGSNAALEPHNIAASCYELGINVSCKKGTLQPRWAWEEIELDFDSTGSYARKNKALVPFAGLFEGGKFQGFFPYLLGTVPHIGVIISGIIYLINKRTFSVTALNKDDPLLINHTRVNWSTAGRFFTVFDFPNYPMILDGATARRANPDDNEIPVSVLGTYNQNRLFISNAGIDFTAGDPTGSSAAPDAPITFKEIQQASSPFVAETYQLPTNTITDTITAMGFLQVIDTSTGFGPLLIGTKTALYSFNTQNQRATWLQGNFGSLILNSAGIAGQRAQANVGGDLIFQSPDGLVRALSMARNDARRWGNSPISNEVETVLKAYDLDLVAYSAISYHKNKLFVTTNPYRLLCTDLEGKTRVDIAHGGYVVMEYDNISTIGNQSPPVWAGLWTGIRPMDMIEVDGDAFVIAKDGNTNKIYRVREDRSYDYKNKEWVDIHSRIYSREYTWNDITTKKALINLSLGVKDLTDKVTFSAAYKPSHGANYAKWNTVNFTAPYSQCKMPVNAKGFKAQGIRELVFGGVDDQYCEGTSRELYNQVKGVQVRLDISGGGWKLIGLELTGRVVPENDATLTICEDLQPIEVVADCKTDWYNL